MDPFITTTLLGICVIGYVCVNGSEQFSPLYDPTLSTNYTTDSSLCLATDPKESFPKCSEFHDPICDLDEGQTNYKDVCLESELPYVRDDYQCPIRLQIPLLCIILGNDVNCSSCLRSIQEGSCKDIPNALKIRPLCQMVRWSAVVFFITLAAYIAFLCQPQVQRNQQNRIIIRHTTVDLIERHIVSIYGKIVTFILRQAPLNLFNILFYLLQGSLWVIFHTFVFLIQNIFLPILCNIFFLSQQFSLAIIHTFALIMPAFFDCYLTFVIFVERIVAVIGIVFAPHGLNLPLPCGCDPQAPKRPYQVVFDSASSEIVCGITSP